jgi:hypothetical protein
MLRAFWLVCLALVCAIHPACSSETDSSELTASGGPGAGGADNRFFAEPNGVHVTETDACSTLRAAVDGRAMALGCVKTIRSCPNFLRVLYQPECMEYDQGSVQGCVAFFNGINNCAELVEDDCVVTAYPGTEPAGCP